MKKTLTLSVVTIGVALTMACTSPLTKSKDDTSPEVTVLSADNPFFAEEYQTPEQVPPFDVLRVEHFMPAFNQALRLHQEEVAALCNNPEKPTFSNTVERYEHSGKLLTKVEAAFNTLTSANSNDALDTLAGELAPRLTKHYDGIFLNPTFFSRINAVYAQRDHLGLRADQQKLLSDLYRTCIQKGAHLSPEKKQELETINQRLSTLTETFSKNQRKDAENYQLLLKSEEQLGGLPPEVIEMARAEAIKAGSPAAWLFTIQRSSITPFLTYSNQRDLRQNIYQAYQRCGNNNNEFDNKKIILEIVSLRQRQAHLLGYPHYAAFSLENSMAKTTTKVYGLLDKLWPAALHQATVEAQELQRLIDKEKDPFPLAGWDWSYYAERIRKQKYDLDEAMLQPYFSLPATLQGAFYLAERLYGLEFVERNDLPVYHPQVRTFSVFDKNRKLLGLYYLDPYRRTGKRAGAWMDTLRAQGVQGGKNVLPIIINVLNFNPPASPQAAVLLSLDEASTVLHEFGHALHGLMSAVTYSSQAGTSVYRDFVEYPSQVMENWLIEPEFLHQFAKHYATGEAMPEALIGKIQRAKLFNQGFAITEYMAAAYLDLAWHTVDPTAVRDVDSFEQETLAKRGLISAIAPRYHSTYFLHIFASGYAAGYYSYQWSQILDADTYALFSRKGIFDRGTGERFRSKVLAKGGSEEAAALFRDFRGRDPEIAPLLQRLGFPAAAK